MSITTWLRRRNPRPAPVRPAYARAMEAAALVDRQALELAAAREEAARWKRHSETHADERDTAVRAFNSKVLEAEDRTRERDGAYRERAQLLAWLTALHPSTAVITPARDLSEAGWALLYVVAGGWQMSWHIAPTDVRFFEHVTAVGPEDSRAQWDGHGSDEKYERLRHHVRLLVLEGLVGDGSATPVTGEASDV
ncbi:hypothetical protein ACFXAZ_33295 [Streptomyces sp. NPDC059477]|uniref:hypothetical protein n=1 Tax=Streptomyces sp. NPDC059477 TaxID=3346847 RepID=UPI0036824263